MTTRAALKKPKDTLLSGQIAEGMDIGCIACHNAARGDRLSVWYGLA
ncbi:MAG: hypothetical protein VCB14_06595 [Alphaproteobacteria bacterium]